MSSRLKSPQRVTRTVASSDVTYHDDAVLEFPQSGERFEGLASFASGADSTRRGCSSGSGGSPSATTSPSSMGAVNTGICVFEAADEEAARRYMAEDPTIASGFARGELRPFRAAFVRPAEPRR